MIDEHFAVALLKSLLHFCWQGTLVAVLVLYSASCFRSAQSRYSWLVSGLALLAILPISNFVWFTASQTMPEVASVVSSVPADQPASDAFDGMSSQLPVAATDQVEASDVIAEASAQVDRPAGFSEGTGEKAARLSYLNSTQIAPWLAALYLLGVACMLLRLVWSLFATRRLSQGGRVVSDASILRVFERECERARLAFRPSLRVCAEVAVPTVAGLIKPVVLIPASLMTGMSPEELRLLLAHELMHIRRFDIWFNCLQRTIEALLFFHPCVWILSRRISREREMCCDDGVVAKYDSAAYARALVRMAELAVDGNCGGLQLSADGGGRPSELRQRVQRLLGHQPDQRRSGQMLAVLLCFGLIVLLSASGWIAQSQFAFAQFPFAQTKETPNPSATSSDETEEEPEEKSTKAALHGAVIDADYLLVPRAAIEVYSLVPDVKLVRKAITDDRGWFEIKDLPRAKYTVKAIATYRENGKLVAISSEPQRVDLTGGGDYLRIRLKSSVVLDAPRDYMTAGEFAMHSTWSADFFPKKLAEQKGRSNFQLSGRAPNTGRRLHWGMHHQGVEAALQVSAKRVGFALVGKIDRNQDGRDDFEEIRKLVEQAGGRIDERMDSDGEISGSGMSPDTSFLILGTDLSVPANATEEQRAAFEERKELYADFIDRARRNGIIQISLDKLLGYVNKQNSETRFPAGRDAVIKLVFRNTTYRVIRFRLEAKDWLRNSRLERQTEEGQIEVLEDIGFELPILGGKHRGMFEIHLRPWDEFEFRLAKLSAKQIRELQEGKIRISLPVKSDYPVSAMNQHVGSGVVTTGWAPVDGSDAPEPKRSFTFRGRVIDGKTGLPIKAFRTVPASVSEYFEKSPYNLTWQGHLLAEHQNGNLFWSSRGYDRTRLRIEAEGYLPGFTKTYLRSDGDAFVDMALYPSEPLTGKIMDSKGNPAEGVLVARSTQTYAVTIAGGTIREIGQGRGIRKAVATDAEGRFSLPSESEAGFLVAAHPDLGYAQIEASDFKRNSSLRLQPWSKISGKVVDGEGDPLANQTIWLNMNRGIGNGMPSISSHQEGNTGPDGVFEFEQIPPGAIHIQRGLNVRNPESDEMESHYIPGSLVRLNLKPSVVQELNLGSPSATVVGKLTSDQGHDFQEHYVRLVPEFPPMARFPGQVDSFAIRANFLNSISGKHYQIEVKELGKDGSFSFPNVPAGRFQIRVFGKKDDRLVRHVSTTVTVPYSNEVKELDIGEVRMLGAKN
ncbi:MAG: M56 family metallopeptidase [Planctomycetota bacterium]